MKGEALRPSLIYSSETNHPLKADIPLEKPIPVGKSLICRKATNAEKVFMVLLSRNNSRTLPGRISIGVPQFWGESVQGGIPAEGG